MGIRLNTSSSERLYNEARNFIAGGVNGDIKFRHPYPIFAKHADGAHIWDVDGNEYIDYVLSYGAIVLGHGHIALKRAIERVLTHSGTTAFGTPNEEELELGRMILSLYHPEGKLRLTNSGLEATLLAVRLAMGYTKKRKIAKFDGHYHGANPFLLANYRPKRDMKIARDAIEKEPDSLDVSGDILDGIIILEFNNIEQTKRILDRNRDEIAAIMMEPFEDGYIAADEEFLHFIRDYTERHGIILIFDEVKTGFRVRVGGASEYYKVRPDIVCLGKIMGGGLPIGGVCGRSDIMDQLDPSRSDGLKIFHSGTFNGNPLSVGAGIATIKELMKEGVFESLESTASVLRNGIDQVFADFKVPHSMYGVGGIVNFSLGDGIVRTYRDLLKTDFQLRKRIDSQLLDNGLFVIGGSRLSVCLSHARSDVDTTIERLRHSLGEMKTVHGGSGILPNRHLV